MSWINKSKIISKSYVCPYCNNLIASSDGYYKAERDSYGREIAVEYIYLCPHCNKPTYAESSTNSYPGIKYGDDVLNVPESIYSIYNEARSSFSVNSFTAVLMLCRKLIMNISVNCGAKENQSFKSYIEFLDSQNYIPRNSKKWVDKIRLKGNEATHEIIIGSKADASEILDFSHMLLKVIYEFNK